MGFGIKTKLIQNYERVFRYRLPALRWKMYGDTSQHGEYLLLRRLTGPDFPHSIVDVGANDGKRNSNSYPFIARGWSAVLIEPNPRVFARLVQTHAGNAAVHALNFASAQKTGKLPLFLGKDGEVGEYATLSTEENEYYRLTRTEQSVEVSVETLTTLLRQVDWPKDFGILSIDTEGFDYDVLAGLDFAQFSPRIIITEDENSTDAQKFQLLRSKGYTFHRRFARNSIWLLQH